jgi:hypothetical protein
MKNIALGLLVTVFALASFAAEGKNVSYQSGGETVEGMLYTPPRKGPSPAIIVIHEYWGLNRHRLGGAKQDQCRYSRDLRRKGSGHPAGFSENV